MIRNLIITYGGKILFALAVLIIGLFIIKKIVAFMSSRLKKSNADEALVLFLEPLVKIILQILLIITVASMVGVEVATFVGVIAAASFAVGLALQGSLANFAGGVLILILKPFEIGDYIEAAGYAGTVTEIQVFYTILHTPDNKKVIIPNANLSNNSAVNYTANDTRRIDFKFDVSYEDDIQKVRETLKKMAAEHSLIFKDPEPEVYLGEYGSSSIVIYLRVWCKTEDYWPIYFNMLEKTKTKFDEEKISIPYPQLDVHFDK